MTSAGWHESHLPQNRDRPRGQHHRKGEADGEAEPSLDKAAKDEAVCDLWVLMPQPIRVKLEEQNQRKEKRNGEKTYKKHVNGLLPFHVRPLDLSNLRDEPV